MSNPPSERSPRTTYEADDKTPDEAPPCRERLQWRPVREGRSVKALRLETLVEADIGQADTEPCHQPGDRSHVCEPVEYCRCAAAHALFPAVNGG